MSRYAKMCFPRLCNCGNPGTGQDFPNLPKPQAIVNTQMDSAAALQHSHMMGRLCLPLRTGAQPHLRHVFTAAGYKYSPSRLLRTAITAMRRDLVQQQHSRGPRLPPPEAWRSHHTSLGPDLLAEPSGRGCSCCGDYGPFRERRPYISRPEPVAGPSGRGMSAQATALQTDAAPVRSHEEEAAALQGALQRRIQLFEQYRQREREAVSATPCS